MLTFPTSLLILPAAVALGAIYVRLMRVRQRALRSLLRILLLSLTWSLPLFTVGPGPAQLTLGLLVGYLGIRMVALAERWRHLPRPPRTGRVLAAMAMPGDLMAPSPRPRPRPAPVLATGLAAGAACVALMVLGARWQLWRRSLFLDNMLVFVEVAIGAAAIHRLVVGGAALAGRSVLGLQDLPWLSASLSEFWARRWNRLVQSNLDRGFFRPWGRRRAPALGMMNAFLASGAMHVLAVFDAGPPSQTLLPSLMVMAFFLVNGGLVMAERPLGLHPPPDKPAPLMLARLRTVAMMALLSPMLLSPFANVAGVHGRRFGPPPSSGMTTTAGAAGSASGPVAP